MRTLIVEDDLSSRQLLRRFLSRYGDCDIAIDGEDAIQAFKVAMAENKPYQLICLDIQMPFLDGHETLRIIRSIEDNKGFEQENRVKIVMTTADDRETTVWQTLEEGATWYLIKPIKKETLESRLMDLGLI